MMMMMPVEEVIDFRALFAELATTTASVFRNGRVISSGSGGGSSSSSSTAAAWNLVGGADESVDVVKMVVIGAGFGGGVVAAAASSAGAGVASGARGVGGDIGIGGGNGGIGFGDTVAAAGGGVGGGIGDTEQPLGGHDPLAMSDNDEEDRELFLFVTYGILLTFIGLLGLAGNALSIVVLSRPQMRSSINCCLIGLASFDIVVLVTSMLMFGVFHLFTFTGTFPFYERSLYPFLVPLMIYPFGLIAQTGSVWVTVIVTVERYIAVCHPLHAKSICTYSRARAYIVIISLMSVVYNLPRFWEVERNSAPDPSTNETVYELQPSWLRQNRTYVTVYITWIYLFCIYFVPFVLLAVLNGFIWIQVRRANRERQQLSRLQKKEMGLAIMLFCVVVVFFICNVMALVVNVLETVGIIVDQLTVAANLLITINSSVNFSIYCIFGQKFRRILLKTVCSRCFRLLLFRTSTSARRHHLASNMQDLDESFCQVSTTVAETRTLIMFNNNGANAGGGVAVAGVGVGAGGNNGTIKHHQNLLMARLKELSPMPTPESTSSTLPDDVKSTIIVSSNNCVADNDVNTRVNFNNQNLRNQRGGSARFVNRTAATSQSLQEFDAQLTLT